MGQATHIQNDKDKNNTDVTFDSVSVSVRYLTKRMPGNVKSKELVSIIIKQSESPFISRNIIDQEK